MRADPDLRVLRNERDVGELLARYADAVDALDAESLGALFDEDARADLLGASITRAGRDRLPRDRCPVHVRRDQPPHRHAAGRGDR